MDEQDTYVFRKHLNEILKTIFENIRNFVLASTVILAGRYLAAENAKNPRLDIGDASVVIGVGWLLIGLSTLQGVLEIWNFVPSLRKRKGKSDGMRAFALIFIYLPVVIPLIYYLIRSK